ncbi:hypothetical protein K435DRAFT_810027 [Dendrothele bispora CBS 962.96]|uniref:Uncharacterized protein n=1 Tax=Dendrothele bispora (strain CBS 962.96) TaxID=1314807 RepID=A0A4S8KWM9_DENBC|nr:hypothetical protein K435DRAFT_810027 [Dendrothele bispora CBS 962.96]
MSTLPSSHFTTSKLDGNLSTFLPHSGVFQSLIVGLEHPEYTGLWCRGASLLFLSGQRSSVTTRPYPLTSFDKIYTLHNERKMRRECLWNADGRREGSGTSRDHKTSHGDVGTTSDRMAKHKI